MIAREQLKSIVARIERLEEEQASLAEDKKEVYAEAKANGFNCPTLRAVVKIRKLETAEWAEAKALLELYFEALGMTPIERAISESASPRAGGNINGLEAP